MSKLLILLSCTILVHNLKAALIPGDDSPELRHSICPSSRGLMEHSPRVVQGQSCGSVSAACRMQSGRAQPGILAM